MIFRNCGVLFFLAAFLMCGCPYEGNVPLDDVSRAKIDKGLIGKWCAAGREDKGTLSIEQFNDKELFFVVLEPGEEKVDCVRAYTTVMDGETFLNLHEIKGPYEKRKWMYVNYKLKGDTITYRVVEEDIFKKKINNSKILYDFIKKNLKNKELYDDEETLKRVE